MCGPMTTLRLDARTTLDIVAPGGLEFSAEVTINEGDVDYTSYLAFWNIGYPTRPEEALVLGTTATGEAVGGMGKVTLRLSAEVMQALPRRPLPYECWLESVDGLDVVPVAGGKFCPQPFVGSQGYPEGLETPVVVDGGEP